MRAVRIALPALAMFVLLVACTPPPARRPAATFVPGPGDPLTATATVGAGVATAPREASCDVQNSLLQDSGLPLLQVSPVAPRPGDRVTARAGGLVPGARTLTLVAPFQPDRHFEVSVGPDGRLDATFTMPPVPPGRCAMLLLDGTGAQSLGFVVGE